MIWELAQDHIANQVDPLLNAIKQAIATPGTLSAKTSGASMDLQFHVLTTRLLPRRMVHEPGQPLLEFAFTHEHPKYQHRRRDSPHRFDILHRAFLPS